MRFDNEGRSDDIQDRRGIGPVHIAGGLGLGGMLLVGVLSLLTRHNFFNDLSTTDSTSSDPGRGGGPVAPRNAAEAQSEQLVRHATTDIEDFWTQQLPRMANGRAYRRTQLVLFTDETHSGCGTAESQTGPFYCPTDQLAYVDLGFYGELSRRFHAPGDFAQAYVLAHEFGHHVQHLLGIDARARGGAATGEDSNSVKLELQADCFAGVWGSSAARRGLLDPGEVDQGMAAAAAVGDDRLQRMAGRSANPETFTHGSSAERVSWFRRGLQSGTIGSCDTFGNGSVTP